MTSERPHGHPGLFLVLDGPDGGGKTTQVQRLAEWLRSLGWRVTTCRDPGGTALGDRVRPIVLDRSEIRIGLRAEMMLYQASRAQLVEEIIAPALASGGVVISDRYLLANIVYQGTAGGLIEEEVGLVGLVATGGVLPDLTLILDVPVEVARARVGPARDRIEDRPWEYHERVRSGFLAALASGSPCPYYPAPLVRIDAAQDADHVYENLKHEVEHVLAGREGREPRSGKPA